MPSPFTPGWFPDRQHRVAREAQSQGQIDGPLPLLSKGAAPAVTTFDYPNPSFAALTAQNRVARTATDFGQWAGPIPELLNKDRVFAGAGQGANYGMQQALPPYAKKPPSDNFGFTEASAFWLLKDKVFGGAGQTVDYDWPNPNRGAPRSLALYDPGVNLNLPLLASGVVPTIPPGAQATDVPPKAAARASDYSWLQDLVPNLIGQDATLVGAAIEDLPPRAAARARDYSLAVSFPLELIGQDAMAVGQQRLELPTPAPLRARDYTVAQPLPLNLNGRDAMVTSQQLSGNTPPTFRRASTLVDPGVNLTLIISQAPPVIPQGLSTALSELPPRAPARARDYSIAASFPLELVGKDQVFGAPGEVPAYDWSYQPPKPRYQQGTGEPIQDLLGTLLASAARPIQPNVFDLPPSAAPRSRDYSWIWQLQRQLIGQDATNPGVQVSGPAPAGAPRARDYTFLASFPLELIGQDARLAGQQATDLLPPRGAARARDYTLAAGFPLELIGKDAMLVGDQFTDMAPIGAARARDYSLAFFAIVNTTPQRDLTFTTGSPQAKWRTGQLSGKWDASEPGSRWSIRGPKE